MKLTIASMFIASRLAPSVSASGVVASILKHENNRGSVRLSAPKNKECSFEDGFKVNVQKSLQVGIPICKIGELCEEDSTSPLGGRCVTVSSKPIALTPRRQLVGKSWAQVGQDIDGEAAYDQSGRSVSLSGDGNVLAIGAPSNGGFAGSGHVRVFKLVNNSWTQVGQDIDGEAASDQSGHSVSLSSDGNVLAIGANGNDGIGSNSGHVRVFKLDTNTNSWTQVGQDIDGENSGDRSGISVSLSSDGNVLAIGAYMNGSYDSGYSSGHVRVFKLVNNSWNQVGQDIDGEAANDFSGVSVSLSSDGNVLAIGAYRNDGTNAFDSGHVRVFKLGTNSWTQVGQDIDGVAASDNFGFSVSLSSDGNVLAIGANGNDEIGNSSGQVRVFKLKTNSWTQVGQDINGEAAYDQFGKSVSLSSDGNVLAIGAPYNDGNDTNSGHVRVFKLDTNGWTQVGQNIDGENSCDNYGTSVSLSSDGNVLAIGANGNDGIGSDSGHVRVLTAAPVTPSPTITSSPSSAPVTSSPTAAPVTPSPSAAPITPGPTAAPMSTPGWNITYDSMKANLTADTTEELIFLYNISSTRAYEYDLFEKDCSTEIRIGDNLITDNWTSSETNSDGTDRLALFYDINMTAVPSSSIWNETSEQMEMCLRLSLFEPATADDPKMIIAQDKHVFTVGINSTVDLDFRFDNSLQDSVAGEVSSTANLDGYVEARRRGESTPLAPNEVFHVCVKSSSPDVQISDVTQM
eukprot:scaffold110478_cov36-Cyclotella_meneghiniana.AAC.1